MINASLATKGLIGVVGVSAIAGGAYATTQYFSGTPINELLKADDFTLLEKTDSDKAQWGKRWEAYVKAGNKWSLTSFQTNQSKKDDAPEDFKNACIEKSKSKAKNNEDPNYKEIVDLCTKDFSVAELIKKDETIVLISGKTTPSDNSKWKASWEKYYDNARTKNPLGLNLSGAVRETINTEYGAKCTTKEKMEVKNNKDKNYSIVKEWCTESKG